ncbi:hypothetical protein FOFC_03193 [Fusarium oxysporum]|nr:hypothetical protein FOFC_03193 [Fusarium oxysporum]
MVGRPKETSACNGKSGPGSRPDNPVGRGSVWGPEEGSSPARNRASARDTAGRLSMSSRSLYTGRRGRTRMSVGQEDGI